MSAIYQPETNATAPLTAYVQSDGSDVTGTIGNPARPFATLTSAVAAGAETIALGVGAFDLTKTGNFTLHIRGRGYAESVITTITLSAEATVILHLSDVTVGSLEGSGAAGVVGGTDADGTPGTGGATVTVFGGRVDGIALVGGQGGDSGETSAGGPNGGNGGHGGTLYLHNCFVTSSVNLAGGNGGAASLGSVGNAGLGGTGGVVFFYNCPQGTNSSSVTVTGGNGGDAPDGTGGDGGSGGTVTVNLCSVADVLASGGTAGVGSMTAGADGSVVLAFGIVSTSDVAVTGAGLVAGTWQAA